MIRFSFVRSLVGVFALLLAIALPVLAQGVDEPNGDNNNDIPELNLGTATAAFALLSGGLLMLRARRRRRAE